MTRPDLLFLSGAALAAVAGVMVMMSILAAAPTLFYAGFPLGSLGIVVAAVGYVKEDAAIREAGRREQFSAGFGPMLAAPQTTGGGLSRDVHPRRKGR